ARLPRPDLGYSRRPSLAVLEWTHCHGNVHRRHYVFGEDYARRETWRIHIHRTISQTHYPLAGLATPSLSWPNLRLRPMLRSRFGDPLDELGKAIPCVGVKLDLGRFRLRLCLHGLSLSEDTQCL